jgi:hypothetical protein
VHLLPIGWTCCDVPWSEYMPTMMEPSTEWRTVTNRSKNADVHVSFVDAIRVGNNVIHILLIILLAWQNYRMLIGWEEYNYFINCTAVQLMIFLPKTNKMAERYFKHKCEMKWKYEQKHQILVKSLAGLDFGERIWCWHWEVSNFVMLIINK